MADIVLVVQSESNPLSVYQVNLSKGTCQCPAFVKGHKRPCKHIQAAREKAEKLGIQAPILPPKAHTGQSEIFPALEGPKEAPLLEKPPLRFDVKTKEGLNFYTRFESFSRTRLSRHFIMRDFLFSSSSSTQGIHNYPSDDPGLVIKAGKLLCEQALEPIRSQFGHFFITYGYQNRWGIEGDWSEADKEKKAKSSNPHHWDRGTFGKEVYARVDILPTCVEEGTVSKVEFGKWVMDNLDICLLMQWRKSNVFCITISPKPRRVWLEWVPQGKGEKGGNKITFMGEDYWNSFDSLPEDERPKFYPSMSGGKMWWG